MFPNPSVHSHTQSIFITVRQSTFYIIARSRLTAYGRKPEVDMDAFTEMNHRRSLKIFWQFVTVTGSDSCAVITSKKVKEIFQKNWKYINLKQSYEYEEWMINWSRLLHSKLTRKYLMVRNRNAQESCLKSDIFM